MGIDVGADAVWLVGLEVEHDPPAVRLARLLSPVDPDALARLVADAPAVAIDAPGGPSRLAHTGDDRLAAKFRAARCSEIALRRFGMAVPWVTPSEGEPLPGWMTTGLVVWEACRTAGVEPLETYPHGVFWQLSGGPMFHKQRPAGTRERIAVLSRHVVLPEGIEMWGHDGIDALAAAYVAWHGARSSVLRLSCDEDLEWAVHDGSAMWLPPRSGG